jgi:uncharacterized membrane protein YphA (DoxX/SURF4 family)
MSKFTFYSILAILSSIVIGAMTAIGFFHKWQQILLVLAVTLCTWRMLIYRENFRPDLYKFLLSIPMLYTLVFLVVTFLQNISNL